MESKVVKVLVHQCMAGLRGPHSRLPINKPTEFWASDPILIARLDNLKCDGRHQHSMLDAREAGAPADKTKDAARLPLPLCHGLAKGCEDLLRRDKARAQKGAKRSHAATSSASNAFGPPTSGVPVPGAKVGSTKSMS